MRKILIVISVLILILATAVGGGYLYVQHQLNQLPVENLTYRIAAVGYKHIRLADVSFTYIEPARDIDALSSGFRSGDTALEAPVALSDVFITWQWHGFKPNVQIVEVGKLDFTLSHWPSALQETNQQNELADWQLPEDWRVSEALPYKVEINEFVVDLPCADRCYYSGYVSFSSENKEQFLTADAPQHTELSLSLSPHQHFHEMEQINLYLDYRVVGDLPELDIVVQSPQGFNFESSQQLDRSNSLRGEIALELEPSAHWIFTELWQWWPQLENQTEPVLNLLSDRFVLDATYESEMPTTSVQRWANEINARVEAELTLRDQLFVHLESQLHRDDQITFDGHIEARLLPGLRTNLAPLLGLQEPAAESPFQPATVLAQINAPVELGVDWGLQFPPGTEVTSWRDQADGDLALTVESESELNFAAFALTELSGEAEIQLAAGTVRNLDLFINGGFDLLTFTEQLNRYSFDPDRVHWSIHAGATDFIDWADLPLHIQAQSTGNSDITFDALLRADVAGYLSNPDETTLNQISLTSTRGQLMMRQPELHIEDLNARDIEFKLPFTMRFSATEGLNLNADNTAQLNMAVHMPFNDEVIQTEQLKIDLSDWQWHMPIGTMADSQFSTQLDMNATSLEVPALLPVNWRWFGSLTAKPLGSQPELKVDGRLTNSAGLTLRQQLTTSSEQLILDWQLADIFWLAGNPVAATLDNLWPELLTLERGRTRASGQIQLPFDDTPASLSAELELLDVAGIYDTASFSGARAILSGSSDGENFVVNLKEGYLQRIQYGMTHGPGEIQLRYSGALTAPLEGVLDIGSNRLNVLNGEIALLPASYELSQPEHTFYIDISQLDLARLLAEYPATEIQGSGLLSGTIPVRYSPEGIFVDTGRIAALPPGGQIQYRSERAQQMAQSNMAMGIVMGALDDFHYSALQGDVTYLEDGTLQIGLLVEGHNPGLENGRPVRLEITLQEDLPALLTSLQLTNQLNELIQERVQQRLIQGLRN